MAVEFIVGTSGMGEICALCLLLLLDFERERDCELVTGDATKLLAGIFDPSWVL